MFWADDSESVERGATFAGSASGTPLERYELVLGPVSRPLVATSPAPPLDRRKSVELATPWRRRWLAAAPQPEW